MSYITTVLVEIENSSTLICKKIACGAKVEISVLGSEVV